MNDVFKANISYNKSKSKSSVHNETVEKSSLVSGRNMNIKSRNGSISISGTDVKVGNDLDLNAKKDITIKASEENFTSSNSSSQMGIGLSADLSKGKIADLSISKAGTKGRGNGTNYINSTVNAGGKLKTDSENLTLSGANVEADKLDIKAKNLVIESKQDKSERKDSSYGGSFSIDLANPSSFSANINGSKGSGEKEWVNKQTSLIAKNGEKVDTDSLTNIGAVIGSENEKEKLKVSANKVVVKDLEDKNKYENIGGGITIGTDVPNTSIKHDKVDKEQIDRATAINTDFEISGKKTSAEDLGFNTDINKAQEKTKDEEKHLDAELHTDLLGKDKQEELKKAGGILGDIGTALTSTKDTRGDLLERYKQASMMRAIGDQVEKNPEYLSILEKETIKNGKIDDKTQIEQVLVMNKLLNDALRAKGYAGPDIKMVLTDVNDPNGPYYTDTLTNTVVFDRTMLANANRDEILNALGHEFGHYSKEDNKTGTQTIANYSGEKLEDRTKGMVSKEATEDTLAAIRNNKNVITGEKGRLLAESIPMERREYALYSVSRELDYSEQYYKLKEAAEKYAKNPSLDTREKYDYELSMSFIPFLSSFGTHGYILYVPEEDEQEEAKKNTDDYFPLYGEFEGKVGRTYGGHNIDGNLEVVPNQPQDKLVVQKITKGDKTDKLTPLKGYMKLEKLESSVYDTKELDKKFLTDMDFYIKNQKNGLAPKYGALGLYNREIKTPLGTYRIKLGGVNCNSLIGTEEERLYIENIPKDAPGIDPGRKGRIPEEMFK